MSRITNKDKKIIEKTRSEAKRVLLSNYEAVNREYITPAWPHYKNQWLWDSCFHAIACAELGMEDMAKNEIEQLLKFQDERGWVPHQIFHGRHRWFDLERWLYGKEWHFAKKDHSSVIAPPVLAQAVEAIGDKEFTKSTVAQLVAYYKYFIEYRDALNILSIFTPRESGRDADPIYDFFRPAPKARIFRFLDRIFDPLFVLMLDLRYKWMDWDEKTILKKSIFNVKDLATHCIWIDGLYSLRNLLQETGQENLFANINEVIKKAEDIVIEKAWDEEDEVFYNLRATKSGTEKIREISVSNLFPLLIDSLPKHMEEATINLLTNPHHFWTAYPIPCVPVSHPDFEPQRSFPIWRGPTWINMNWFLIRALMKKGYNEIAERISKQTTEMVYKEGYREFYNPFTGEGRRVQDFSWSTIAVTFPSLVKNKKEKHERAYNKNQ